MNKYSEKINTFKFILRVIGINSDSGQGKNSY